MTRNYIVRQMNKEQRLMKTYPLRIKHRLRFEKWRKQLQDFNRRHLL